ARIDVNDFVRFLKICYLRGLQNRRAKTLLLNILTEMMRHLDSPLQKAFLFECFLSEFDELAKTQIVAFLKKNFDVCFLITSLADASAFADVMLKDKNSEYLHALLQNEIIEDLKVEFAHLLIDQILCSARRETGIKILRQLQGLAKTLKESFEAAAKMLSDEYLHKTVVLTCLRNQFDKKFATIFNFLNLEFYLESEDENEDVRVDVGPAKITPY